MRVLSFWVEGCPVPKGRPRTVRLKNGRTVTFTPKRTARWETTVRLVAQAACSATSWRPDAALYDVTLTIYPARRAGDSDNFAKAITDAMNGVVYPDDRSIRKLTIERKEVGVGLGVMVRVTKARSA